MSALPLSCLVRSTFDLRRARRILSRSRRLKARSEALHAEAARILHDLERREATRTPTIAGITHSPHDGASGQSKPGPTPMAPI